MLVGICWEKVCETQPSSHGLRNHLVIGTALVARLLLGCVVMLSRLGTGTLFPLPRRRSQTVFCIAEDAYITTMLFVSTARAYDSSWTVLPQ